MFLFLRGKCRETSSTLKFWSTQRPTVIVRSETVHVRKTYNPSGTHNKSGTAAEAEEVAAHRPGPAMW